METWLSHHPWDHYHHHLTDMVGQGQVEEARGLDLAPVGPAGAVTHKVHTKLSLGGLDGGVGGASGDLSSSFAVRWWYKLSFKCYRESLGEELEVVDEGLHRGLHLRSAGGHTLGVVCPHVTCNVHLMTIITADTVISHQPASGWGTARWSSDSASSPPSSWGTGRNSRPCCPQARQSPPSRRRHRERPSWCRIWSLRHNPCW